VTSAPVGTEPPCTEAQKAEYRAARGEAAQAPSIRIEARSLTSIPRATWDRLASANPFATPFSSWAFHRAWWDAYSENAHEQTLVAVDAAGASSGPGSAEPIAIIPLMHRHEVEPGDDERHTTLRHEHGPSLTPVPPTAKAIFFGASYHADYATLLAAPADLPPVAQALVEHLADDVRGESDPSGHRQPWDVVDLRRLRCEDPVADALAGAFRHREMAEGWTLNLEREDVCPVATLPKGGTIDDYLATLGKKERHEIRRKVRRAEAVGEVALTKSTSPLVELDAFIDLHQRRWGAEGLFPDTQGGAQSRLFVRRLFEHFGPDGELCLCFLTVGGRRIAAGLHFETADTILYYNAGIDPDARDLSPGVLMVERFVRRALARGQTRIDFLRGDEGYKYEWGAQDEPIQRLLVRRAVA
jgi:CelD/BcsL family acetyltransferase involved in cellulose biosynthesis